MGGRSEVAGQGMHEAGRRTQPGARGFDLGTAAFEIGTPRRLRELRWPGPGLRPPTSGLRGRSLRLGTSSLELGSQLQARGWVPEGSAHGPPGCVLAVRRSKRGVQPPCSESQPLSSELFAANPEPYERSMIFGSACLQRHCFLYGCGVGGVGGVGGRPGRAKYFASTSTTACAVVTPRLAASWQFR